MLSTWCTVVNVSKEYRLSRAVVDATYPALESESQAVEVALQQCSLVRWGTCQQARINRPGCVRKFPYPTATPLRKTHCS